MKLKLTPRLTIRTTWQFSIYQVVLKHGPTRMLPFIVMLTSMPFSEQRLSLY